VRARGSARGRRRWTRHRRRARLQQQKARSAAACSIVSAAVPCRFRALPLDVVRLDIPREHRVRADLLHEGACRATASAPSSADTCPGAAAPPEKAAHMQVGAAAEEPAARIQRAYQRFRSLCRARAHRTGYKQLQTGCSGVLHARGELRAYGHIDASERQGSIAGQLAKDVNNGGGEPPVAPRLVSGSKLLRATATRARRSAVPRSTCRKS
jgi:hypothetical protein